MKDESRPGHFESRAREVFDASIEAMDGPTRSRLMQSRHRAVEAASSLAARAARERWTSWVPVGALAAGVLAAALLLRGPSPDGSPSPSVAATPATLTQGTIEMIAAGDEFEIATADEALEFYRWVEEATANGGEGRS